MKLSDKGKSRINEVIDWAFEAHPDDAKGVQVLAKTYLTKCDDFEFEPDDFKDCVVLTPNEAKFILDALKNALDCEITDGGIRFYAKRFIFLENKIKQVKRNEMKEILEHELPRLVKILEDKNFVVKSNKSNGQINVYLYGRCFTYYVTTGTIVGDHRKGFKTFLEILEGVR